MTAMERGGRWLRDPRRLRAWVRSRRAAGAADGTWGSVRSGWLMTTPECGARPGRHRPALRAIVALARAIREPRKPRDRRVEPAPGPCARQDTRIANPVRSTRAPASASLTGCAAGKAVSATHRLRPRAITYAITSAIGGAGGPTRIPRTRCTGIPILCGGSSWVPCSLPSTARFARLAQAFTFEGTATATCCASSTAHRQHADRRQHARPDD